VLVCGAAFSQTVNTKTRYERRGRFCRTVLANVCLRCCRYFYGYPYPL
jgi:hypothetical protein